MEVAQARFPFPPPGHPPLSMIDLVQYVLETNISQLLEDDPDSNLIWTKSFRHFLSMWYAIPIITSLRTSLEKNFDKRPSPEQIMQHPWVVGMQKLKVNMEKWIKEAWGWK
jgi:mitogen-activated protein kinase kinase